MCWLDAGEGGEMERSFKSSVGSESWADGATGADDKKFGEEGENPSSGISLEEFNKKDLGEID